MLNAITDRAKAIPATLVYPEGDDLRVLKASMQVVQEGIARALILGDPRRVLKVMRQEGLEPPETEYFQIIDPHHYPRRNLYANEFYRLRQYRGIGLITSQHTITTPLLFAAMMVRLGDADGCIAGAAHTTGDVMRTALQIIGLKQGCRTASSCFLMTKPEAPPLTFADCGIIPEPTADQLVDITLAAAENHQMLTGDVPRVALLSFSTLGSAQHDSVKKVQQALVRLRHKAPKLLVDGELQFDAAFVPSVGERKAPASQVAGCANVFIFPNLNAGNIGYKIAERLGNYQAIGPIIQGLYQPMHDLSRGCAVADIIALSSICVLQTQPALQ